MPPSSIGFGHNPFGGHQFGSADWAEEMLWKLIPEFYRTLDESGPSGSVTPQPLRGLIDAFKPFFQELRLRFEQFPDLWDATAVPLAQLPALAYNVGITVDAQKSEGLQRSSVLNASQLWINKGTPKGYQITAAFEGLLVNITPLWAESCAAMVQRLTTIGSNPASYNLATTPIDDRPVAPGTLHIKVTTALGIEEDIRDDGNGALVGIGSQLNGALTRLNITTAITLNLTSILGTFSAGDNLTQGLTTGTVLGVIGVRVKVQTTAGAFTTGPINNTTSGATATVASFLVDSLAVGDTVRGQTTGTTAVVRDNAGSYVLIDKITTWVGFGNGETLIDDSSNFAVAGSSTPLVQGPLRTRTDLSALVGTFVVDEEIVGGTSGARGIVRSVGATWVFVDTITSPGFTLGETITGGTSGATATVDAQSQGSINYLTGELIGHTVALEAESTVTSVTDLVTSGPDQWVPTFDATPADVIPLDYVQTDPFTLWPRQVVPVRIKSGIITEPRCRSFSLRLFFYKPDDTEIENFQDVAARINAALDNFRPIHVRFDRITYDGTRAGSHVWRAGPIKAENSASSLWTIRVTGEQKASSQVWTAPIIQATAAI